jgi:hypothetical protein
MIRNVFMNLILKMNSRKSAEHTANISIAMRIA